MAEKAKKPAAKNAAKTVSKANKPVATKDSENKFVSEYKKDIDEFEKRVKSNPCLMLGMLMAPLQFSNSKPVLYYIAELEKKFTPEELVKIAAKVMKK